MKNKIYCLLLIILLCFCIRGAAQVNSDAVLFANGHKNYIAQNWVYASIYFFALIQRNPKAFSDDPSFKQEVVDGFNFSMQSLNGQVDDAKAYAKMPGGSSQSGLHSKPPYVRDPTTVQLNKY
jgi:hypothetical protein